MKKRRSNCLNSAQSCTCMSKKLFPDKLKRTLITEEPFMLWDSSQQATCDSWRVMDAVTLRRPHWGWRSKNDLHRLQKMWNSRNKMSELGIANRRRSAMRGGVPGLWKCGGCECQRRGRAFLPHAPDKSHLSGPSPYETWDTSVATAHSCCCLLWRGTLPSCSYKAVIRTIKLTPSPLAWPPLVL